MNDITDGKNGKKLLEINGKKWKFFPFQFYFILFLLLFRIILKISWVVGSDSSKITSKSVTFCFCDKTSPSFNVFKVQ